MRTSYSLTPSSVFHLLLRVFLVIFVMNLVSMGVEHYMLVTGKSSVLLKSRVVELFNFDLERNVPTYFNWFILLLSGVILYVISKFERGLQPVGKFHRHWFYLSCIFFFLSLDELFGIHEITNYPLRTYLLDTLQRESLGMLYFAWVIPYFIAVVFLGLYFLKFLFSLPRQVAVHMVIAGMIYVVGAIGVEMVASAGYEEAQEFGLQSRMWATLEETMEMMGIIFFIRTLLLYLTLQKYPTGLLIDLHVPKKAAEAQPQVANEMLTQ